jgi:hypothetical protein
MISRLDRKKFSKCLFLTVVFNTVISLFLTSLGVGAGLAANFILSQCIGLSIGLSVLAGYRLVGDPSPAVHVVMLFLSMVSGATVGSLGGAFLAGFPLSTIFQGKPAPFFQMLLMGILFGAAITYFFVSRERIHQSEAMAGEEKIRRLTVEKKAAENHLRLLQAQIEPHFLFNTLSNVVSLLETNPQKAKEMVLDLTRYLRTSLSRTRQEKTTLDQELSMVCAYLSIFKVRMGERLRYKIDVPEPFRSRPFPPMLVQPLVENAIRHGLEPKIEGGEISIRMEETPQALRLIVSDTGCGLDGNGPEGVGLINVRERLAAIYDGKARLILEENRPEGLTAIIEIPHEER